MTRLPFCRGLPVACCFAALVLSDPLRAETGLPTGCADLFEAQRITIVVPNAAGGGYDLYARALAPVLSEVSGAAALVSNMPGGAGKAALVRTALAPTSEMVLYFDGANDVLTAILTDPSLNLATSDLEVAGIVHSEPEAWLGQVDVDLADPALTDLVSATSTVESDLVPVILAARALGIGIKVVSGYDGSSETQAAILRGEADISSMTLSTALRGSEANEARVAMILDDAPHPDHPEIPWFGGAGGLIEQRGAGLSDEDRKGRAEIGQMVMTLSRKPRTLFIPTAMDSGSKACLLAALEVALNSEAFAAGALAVKRPISPLVGAEARASVAELATAMQAARPVLDTLFQELQGQ